MFEDGENEPALAELGTLGGPGDGEAPRPRRIRPRRVVAGVAVAALVTAASWSHSS